MGEGEQEKPYYLPRITPSIARRERGNAPDRRRENSGDMQDAPRQNARTLRAGNRGGVRPRKERPRFCRRVRGHVAGRPRRSPAMQCTEGSIGRVFSLRIDDGEDVLEELTRSVRERGIACGMVQVLGALRDGRIVAGPERPVFPPVPHRERVAGGWGGRQRRHRLPRREGSGAPPPCRGREGARRLDGRAPPVFGGG